MLYIILAVLMFGLLIAVHEFGHFASAKLFGIQVNEFSVGMGPTLFEETKTGKHFTVSVLCLLAASALWRGRMRSPPIPGPLQRGGLEAAGGAGRRSGQ